MTKTHLPLIGVHTSIGKGLAESVNRAEQRGCDCFQIFARNPRGWAARPLGLEEIATFRNARERSGLWPLAIHSIYLINLAAPDPVMLARSRETFREEISRALELGADYLVVHPGNPVIAPAEAGIPIVVNSIRFATRNLKLNGAASSPSIAGRKNELTILIENTAGQGSSIGADFDQVAELLQALDDLPIGVCLDTAHTFAAGYDISTQNGLRTTIRAIDQSFGFGKVSLIHCNDSKAQLGSRVDRHQHIGLGYIGAEAFSRLTHNLKFRRVPFILETPIDKEYNDEWNLNRIRSLSRGECDAAVQSKEPIAEAGRRIASR
jgi:deoxyribonuclease IV